MPIEVTSTAFAHGQPIPKKYADVGANVSPPIFWSGLPEGTNELVLICDDPDAPTAEPWVHWVIYKIPATLPGLPEGLEQRARLKHPLGALQGKNSWPTNNIGYRGPAPPSGRHRYYFKLYAMEAKMALPPGVTKKFLLEEMKGHVLEEGVLIGTYER